MRFNIKLLLILFLLILTGCATTPPPRNPENVCEIFRQYPKWYRAAKNTEQKWGVPVSVQMAIMYYESAFQADARPPSRYVLGIFPGKPISSAYGYAQALDGTWNDYLACAGSCFASRTSFESATDFIGWYGNQVNQQLGISTNDPYSLYLAYHEGITGYQHKSYLKKPWLMRLAKRVASKTQSFKGQLAYFEHACPTAEPTMEQNIDLETPVYFAAFDQDSFNNESRDGERTL